MVGPDVQTYRTLNCAALALLGILTFLLWQAEVKGSSVTLWGWRLGVSCIHRRLTGNPCCGCGLTRGLVVVLNGSIGDASRLHPSAPWVGGWLGAQLLARAALALLASRAFRFWLLDLILSLATMVAAVQLPMLLARQPAAGKPSNSVQQN